MLRATVVSSLSPVACPFHRIKEPCRTAVILDAVSGLCVGELLGLKWLDVNFEQFELNVTRSVSRQVVTPCKTEVSRKPIPMNPEIAEMFSDGGWKLHTRSRAIRFSPARTKRESNRIGLDRCSGRMLRPALLRANISAKVGWHTLRHSFGTLMKANGEDLKTIQELLRHATFKVTADTYPKRLRR
jgi:integrase